METEWWKKEHLEDEQNWKFVNFLGELKWRKHIRRFLFHPLPIPKLFKSMSLFLKELKFLSSHQFWFPFGVGNYKR